MSTTTGGELDWVALGKLAHLVVEDADLALVELFQLGLLDPLQHLTAAAERAAGGTRLVFTDARSTPLALAEATEAGWLLTALRDASGLEPLPVRFGGSVVVVDGPVAGVPALPAGDRLWLVPAAGNHAGRRLLNQARTLAESGERVARLPQATGQHRWLVPSATLTADDVAARLGARTVVHLGDPAAPAGDDRGGTVVFFTGLSGSGKSTLAAALQAELEQLTERPLTLLDGDEVRRTLSDGLGFDKASREANIRRIGWVAALASRHGGIAIAAPIAPFASGRAEARRLATDVGEFLLVWVSTDLETCERRDRKGLYARARAGTVREFTGISSPYENPDDADLVVDTGREDVATAVGRIVDELRRRGRLPARAAATDGQ